MALPKRTVAPNSTDRGILIRRAPIKRAGSRIPRVVALRRPPTFVVGAGRRQLGSPSRFPSALSRTLMKPLLREKVAQVTDAADGRTRENFGQAGLAGRCRGWGCAETAARGEP